MATDVLQSVDKTAKKYDVLPAECLPHACDCGRSICAGDLVMIAHGHANHLRCLQCAARLGFPGGIPMDVIRRVAATV